MADAPMPSSHRQPWGFGDSLSPASIQGPTEWVCELPVGSNCTQWGPWAERG